MDYLVQTYGLNCPFQKEIIARDKRETCTNSEEVVRRLFANNSGLTVNLSPLSNAEVLKQNLASRNIDLHPENWLENGVPDLLIITDSDPLFVEVKKPRTGLTDTQLKWMTEHEQKTLISWVPEVENIDNVDRLSIEEIPKKDFSELNKSTAKSSIDKAIQRILWICYGNHPQSSNYRELAEMTLRYLRQHEPVEKSELAERLGLDISVEAEDRKFKRIMQPLKGDKGRNPLDIQVVHRYSEGHDSYYELAANDFLTSFNEMDQSISGYLFNSSESPEEDFEQTPENLREENQSLQNRIEELEARLENQ